MRLRRIKNLQEPLHKTNKRKIKLKKLFSVIRFLLVSALFATTVVYIALSPLFNIDKIIVKDSVHYDGKVLADASGILVGRNGFRTLFDDPGRFYLLRVGKAERSIVDRCPYVKSARVRFLIPSTISVEVTEREAAAVLETEGARLLVDKEAYLLELDPDMSKNQLPVIKGIKAELKKPGKKLDISEEMLLSAFNVFDTIGNVDKLNEDKLLPYVDYVDVGDQNNVRFSLQSRVVVNLGDMEDLHYKITAAKTIFARNIKNKERGILDFSSGTNPVFTPENGG